MAVDYITLSAYLDGEILDESERRAIERQLASSPVYAREFERLRGARALLRADMDQPTFHRQLMTRAHQLEHRRRALGPWPRWMWRITIGAAVVVALAAVADYAGFIGLARPGSSSISITQWRGAEAPAAATAAPVLHAGLPDAGSALQLHGTVGEPTPTALIVLPGTDEPDHFHPGDDVLPGVRLVDVRYGQAVLEYQGRREILHTSVPDAHAALEGHWFLQWRADAEPWHELECVIHEDRGMFYLIETDGDPFAVGRRDGLHVMVDFPTSLGTVRVEGDITRDADALLLTGIRPTGNVDQPHFKVTVRAERR